MKDYKIYPKQFINDKIPIEKNRCFMLMPFSPEFDYIYGTIKKDLNENGLICNRADEIAGSKPILNKILTEILKSRYIIADLTDYNPNVFYLTKANGQCNTLTELKLCGMSVNS